ncbi:MAG: DUF5696 domain-containing protein [Oscillospiraceae bacterium]|nr:DUF5696 domain-containing protein [Oscillospiraceae bacterium]
MLEKIVKHNKLISLLLVLAFVVSLGTPAWSDEPTVGEDIEPTTAGEDTEPEEKYEAPQMSRQCENPFACEKANEPCEAAEDCGKLLKSLKKVASTSKLELYVLERYSYTALVRGEVPLPVRDETGKVRIFEGAVQGNIDLYDKDGNKTENFNGLSSIGPFASGKSGTTIKKLKPDEYAEYEIESDADEITIRMYTGVDITPKPETMEAGIFAVRNLANNYVWWSNPINASHDPVASSRPMQLSAISSPLIFGAGNPGEPGAPSSFYTNNASNSGFTTMLADDNPIEQIENGVRFNYNFPQRKTKISMEITLSNEDDNNHSVLVTIPHERIIEGDIESEKGSVMLSLSLLNSFGAGSENNGQIVVPDGSGAVINFNNGRTGAYTYNGKVYGRDYAVSELWAPPVTQQVYLPVYGIIRNGGRNALVAVAEKGAENATIRAATAEQRENATSLNVAWFDFTTRTQDNFFIGSKNTSIDIYETGEIKTGDIAVRYFPVAAKVDSDNKMEHPLSYTDVALTYRDYLVNYMNVGNNAAKPNSAPFYMTVNGGTIKTHSIAGFPVDRQTSATTYAQTQTMVERLKREGINTAVVNYNDFNTAGIKRQVSHDVQYSKLLGGKSGYNKLNSAASSSGYELYPSIRFTDYSKSGRGYSFLRSCPREATRARAIQSQYELAFGTPDRLLDTWTVLSPFFYEKTMDSILKSLQSEGIKTVSLDNATKMLYSDFSRENPYGHSYAKTGFNRRDSVQLLTDGFEKFTGAGISIMASQSANAYALPYVSHISNVPMYSSKYDMFNYDVPFYQIAISGLIPYTTKPFNQTADLNRLVLLALSTGTPVHYEFIHENPNQFTDSDYNTLFYASYDKWVDEAVEMYKIFDRIIGNVANQRIVSHENDPDRLTRKATEPPEPDVYETTFEDGTKIRVNLKTYEVQVNGKTVDAISGRRG